MKYGHANNNSPSIVIESVFPYSYESEMGVVISIEDNGIGIPEEDQNLIFNRFYRSKNTKNITFGTGLGLAVVEELSREINVKIWLESAESIGTTFFIFIPIETNLETSKI